ncbi:MAG: SGNH/GDSL hydrolase family protein [Pseudomonadota bacterium]
MKVSLIAGLAVSVVALQAHAASFSDIIVFGDSLADKGRFPQTLVDPISGMPVPVIAPPSNDGRFTDGTTWLEQVGEVFEQGGGQNYNMAVGGAVMSPVSSFVDNETDPSYAFVDSLVTRDPADPDDIPLLNLGTFDRQIDAFTNAGFDKTLGDNPLFVISLGSNDVFQRNEGDLTAVEDDVTEILKGLSDGIQKIQDLDMSFDNFIVTNLPFAGPTVAPILQAYADEFDSQLAAYQSQLGFEIFDFAFANFVAIQKGLLAGINLAACTADLTPATPLDGIDPSKNQCLTPGSSSNFLFADEVHPNSFIHTDLAGSFLTQLGSRAPAPIPLPAGLPLMGAALVGLAVMRRRAK